MATNLDDLFARSGTTPAYLLPQGHMPTIAAVGWGEPPTYYIECICGWHGLTVDTWVPEMLLPELQLLIARYDRYAILDADTIYGDRLDAVRQILEHIKYDAQLQGTTAQLQLEAALAELQEATPADLEGLEALNKRVAGAVKRALLVRAIAFLMETRELPTRPPFNPEAYAAYKEALEKRLKRSQVPQDDADVPRVLKELGVILDDAPPAEAETPAVRKRTSEIK